MAISSIGSYGYNNYNKMRITGMYSGLDTDTLVSNMLAAQQAKVDKIFQKQEKAKWKLEGYTKLNTAATDLKNKYMSVIGENSVTKSATFNDFKVSMKDTSAVEVTAIPSVTETSFHIINASRATAALATSQNLNVQIQRSDSIAAAMEKMGQMVEQTYQVKINGHSFTFDSSTTISEMMSTINRANIGATFSFSELTNSFTLSSTETGANSSLEFSGLESFGLSSAAIQQGRDAQLTVQFAGQDAYTVTQSSNSFTLDGLTFDIKNDHDESQGALSVSVERDYQSTIDAIKAFVEDCNKLIESLNTQYRATKNYDYEPLTEAQREEMTEKEIELWDEKARSGVLRNDLYIGNLLQGLRSTLTEKVGTTGLSAMDIGISTVSWNSSDWKTSQGKLKLDEDKLLKALKEGSSKVQQVFGKVETEDSKGSGFIYRMSDHISSFNSSMRTQGIATTEKHINDYTKQRTEALDKLYERQERLYAQYAQLETLMSSLQSQTNWLNSYLV